MAGKVGQIVGRGRHTWLAAGVQRAAIPRTRSESTESDHPRRLRDAQIHLSKMLGERDNGRNLD